MFWKKWHSRYDNKSYLVLSVGNWQLFKRNGKAWRMMKVTLCWRAQRRLSFWQMPPRWSDGESACYDKNINIWIFKSFSKPVYTKVQNLFVKGSKPGAEAVHELWWSRSSWVDRIKCVCGPLTTATFLETPEFKMISEITDSFVCAQFSKSAVRGNMGSFEILCI